MRSREAARWLVRLHSGREPDIGPKFQRWRDSDPRNAATFERIRRTYEQAALLRHSTNVTARGEALGPRTQQWGLRPAFAAAAALFVIVTIGAFLIRAERSAFAGTEAVMLATKVGEIRQVNLADGSRVTLDTDTRINVQISSSRRRALVTRGRARFQIARGSLPFVVETGTAVISSREGVIDVEQGVGRGRLNVLEGEAEVSPSESAQAPQVALRRGQSLTVGPGEAERIELAPAVADWTRGMLEFDATPLADAVLLANRYSQRRIILIGDLGKLRVTGAFRAGDTVALSRAIAAAFGLSLRHGKDGDLVLSPPTSSQDQKNYRG